MIRKPIALNQAVIFAGGRGVRLKPLTDEIPKPMAPVNGHPFLDYLISSIMKAGIKHILLLVGYKGEVIINRYGNSLGKDIEIGYSIGTVDDQTGRRLLNAHGLLDDYFLLLYGDNYWPIELEAMSDLYNRKKAKVLTTVFSNKNGTGEYGRKNNIEVDEDNFVRLYDKQRKSTRLNGVDIGYFIVDKSALDPKESSNISFEEDFLPRLIQDRQLIAYVSDSRYHYITNMQTLKNFESVVIKNKISCLNTDLLRMR